jgi:tetratricopeptide (TPR) repeat protein
MAQITLRDYLQTTEDAISSGRIADALVNCQQILQHYPNSLEAQRLLGEVYLAQGDFPKAQQAFDWVITNDPENVIAYCSRALISERMQDYDTALDCYQQAYELSRGNGQIRQEFNKLSINVGQQQFIFSRAGLARLFMRGDLLPQATQEWETVLNSNPERLDARTGLLETYWREGLYDKVEQLAQQILNDVPGCLKALLLLAHVTHAQNMQMAQNLLERARTFDPDMVMAQDLFSDLMASQARDPFLTLLKKAPTTIGEVQQPEPVANLATTTASTPYNNSAYDNSSTTSSQFSDSLLTWESLDHVIEQQTIHEASSFSEWDNHTPSKLNSWSTMYDEELPENDKNIPELVNPAPENDESSQDHLQQAATPPAINPTASQLNGQVQQANRVDDTAMVDSELEHNDQPGYDMESFNMPEYQNWNSLSTQSSTLDQTTSWDASGLENDIPAPPAWLEMLTGSGWKSQNETAGDENEDVDGESSAMPSEAQHIPQHEEMSELVHPAEYTVEPNPNGNSSWEEHFTPTEPPQFAQEEDDFSFGPAWLRSLGATDLEDLDPPELFSMDNNLADELLFPTQIDTPSETSSNDDHGESSIDQAELAQESQIATTLEALENDLRTQGFVPLEPGMLSTVAQDDEEKQVQVQDEKQEAGEENLTSSVEDEMQSNLEEEPLWPAATQASARPDFTVQATPTPAQTPTPVPMGASLQSLESTTPERAYQAHYEPQIDADLETTMKRPVVKLQAMQPRSSVLHNQPASKRRTNEQAELNQTSDRKVSNNKERLIKGYQQQLAGSYDDAMQEYRFIIRNDPELLGEVVSNLRALLKLAPKYAPGYRVLGDAYMRQGEYLQAMEAYNKALTMARKAKG